MSTPPREGDAWWVDLHAHTYASHDCLVAPADLVRRAEGVGLARVAVTDHNEISGALEARELSPERVIVGEEVRTAEGPDLIGLFLHEKIGADTPFRQVADDVHRQGGITYLPHPFDRFRGGDEAFFDRVAGCVDLVEGFNARVHRAADNARARRWAERHGLPVGAGSDAHTLGEIGRGRVRVAPFEGAGEFLSALGEGRLRGRDSGWWVHVASTWAKLRKRVSGEL